MRAAATLNMIILAVMGIGPVVQGQERLSLAPAESTQVHLTSPALADSVRSDDTSVRLFLDKIEVEGKLEKPQAVFIIPGMDPEIDDFSIERSFFEDIFRPIERKGRASLRPAPGPSSDRKDVMPW